MTGNLYAVVDVASDDPDAVALRSATDAELQPRYPQLKEDRETAIPDAYCFEKPL